MTYMTLQAVRQLIANDSYAITFQSFGQYRAALLRHFDSLVEGPTPSPEAGSPQDQAPHAVGRALRRTSDNMQYIDWFTPVHDLPDGAYLYAGTAPAAQHTESGAQALMAEALKTCTSRSYQDVDGDWVRSLHYDEEKVRAALAAQFQGAQAAPGSGDNGEAEFARGAIAALAVITSHGYPHGSTFHDEIIACVGEKVIYRHAEDEDYAWAGLNPRKKPQERAALAAKAEAPTHCDPAEGFCAACREQERAQQAAAPGALDPNVFFDALSDFKDSRMTADDGQEFFDKLAAPSAPGTPEAPADQDAARWREVVMMVGAKDCTLFGFPAHKFVLDAMEIDPAVNLMRGSVAEHFTKAIDKSRTKRAAQLDGGQGEERSNVCRPAT